MALSQEEIEFIGSVLSENSIQEQVRIGNLDPEDGLAAIASKTDPDGTTIDGVVEGVRSATDSIADTIGGAASDGLDVLGIGIGDLEDKIKDWILEALRPVLRGIDAIADSLGNAIGSAISTVNQGIVGLQLSVSSGIDSLKDQATQLADTLEDKILDPILSLLSNALFEIKKLDDKVFDIVATATAPIIAGTNSILDRVEGFATALREALPELGQQLVTGFIPGVNLLNAGIKDAASGILNAFFGDIAEEAVQRIEPLIKMFEEELDVSPELRAITAPGILPIAAIGGLMAGFALPMILSNVASTALSPFAEKMRQRMNSLVRPSLVGATDAISGEQKGFMAESLRNIILDRHGLPGDQQTALIELVKLRPGTMDIIDWWRREIYDDTKSQSELHNLGWDDTYIATLREAAFPPPGVQDLIRMAVREVFSPEVAEAFGQFEEIPEAYLKWAKQVGLSDEWARNYWAAHWVLPSVQQGFEMLHRAIISEEDLERLFVALDVMPFWRANLKAISFRPYTRVDVRRMFSLAILDRSGVLRAYLDLGFDPEKAENMTEFTVRWVESTRKVEKVRERDLTKGDIIGLFNDGLLSKSLATSHLATMGYDSNESTLLIQREIVQEMRFDRKADIRLIVDQAKIKVLTFQEAQERLAALDLSQKEMSKAMLEVSRSTSEKIRLPSKADLDNWKGLDLISLGRYEEELDGMGFPSKYVALYVEAIQMEEAEDLLAAEVREARKSEARPVTKGQLDSLLRTDVVDGDQYINGLAKLGFSDSAINDFTTQITIQIEEIRLEAEARQSRGEEAADREKLISRVVLGKLLLKEIIDIDAYQEGLTKLGFSSDSIELLVRLISEKIEAEKEAVEA